MSGHETMSNVSCDHNAWLHLTGGKTDFGLGYENRFQYVIDQLNAPSTQFPSLAFFLGRAKKNAALQQVFPKNKLEQQRCAQDSVYLDVDNTSLRSEHPILFADADPNLEAITYDPCRSACHPHRVTSLPWAAAVPHLVKDIILNRLLFLFTDVICIFADDVGGLDGVKTLLTTWATIGSASSLPSTVRPRVLVFWQKEYSSTTYNLLEGENFRYELLHNTGTDLSQTFAIIKAIVLPGEHLSPRTRHMRLRKEIAKELGRARASRTAASAAFSGTHQNAFFDRALKHLSRTIRETFDFVRAAREGNELGTNYSSHIENFLSLTRAQGIPSDAACSFIASSVLMDAYPPQMHMFDPVVLARTLYRPHILHAVRRVYDDISYAENIYQSIEEQLVLLHKNLLSTQETSSQIHRQNLDHHKAYWTTIQTNLTCLSCIRRKPEHPMQCCHSYCDICVRIFGDGMVGFEHQYAMHTCVICQIRSAVIVKLVPYTAGVRILSIDGGGSLGICSLKWLSMLQDLAGPEYDVQDFFDLSIGTSVGGLIVLILVISRWDIKNSTRYFKSLTRRIFGGDQKPGQSIADKIRRALKCWVSDGLYDTSVLEDALKETFGKESRMFGYRPLVWSGSKAAVTATTTDNSTAFVIANYNGEGELGNDCGYHFGRPSDIERELLVWQAGRATSAAPVYFKPTQVSSVSLQDGCLEHPNPAELAVWESRRIWPNITRPDVLLSLGNGTNAAANSLIAELFRIFFSGFAPRLHRSFTSRIDPEKAWARLRNGLDDDAKQDYIRLNFTFPGVEPRIDNIDCMDELSNCVGSQPYRVRVRKAFSALVVSSLFFELDGIPPYEHGFYHCKGSIRCRSGSLHLIRASRRVHEGVIEFYKDDGSLGCKLDEIDICAVCCRYRRPVEFLVKSLTDPITISARGGVFQGRKLSAMPHSIQWFMDRQSLQSPFGSATHDDPGGLRCQACSPNPILDSKAADQSKRKRPKPAFPPVPQKRRLLHELECNYGADHTGHGKGEEI